MRSFATLVEQYNTIKAKIRRCVLKQQELRELGGLPRTGNNDGMPKAHNPGDSPILNFIIKLDELEREQQELEFSLDCVRNDIERYLDFLNDYPAYNFYSIREIVETKIFTKSSWRNIGRVVGYSNSNTRKLYHDGVDYIESVIKQKENDLCANTEDKL